MSHPTEENRRRMDHPLDAGLRKQQFDYAPIGSLVRLSQREKAD